MSGFSAATSIFAASAMAPESPAGGVERVSLGMRSLPRSASGTGSSCNTASATMTTGSMGGVMAIL